jgi:hypothetical protein
MLNISRLTNPSKVFSRSDVLTKPCPVPKERGLYAWFFKKIPPNIPIEDCVTMNGLNLLYVGISPKNEQSTQKLHKRVTNHYRGNAKGSTLRKTLGVLLSKQSGFSLRRVGSGKRMTFTHLGEQWLDDWMEMNAFVCWIEHPEPWEVEKEIFSNISLPLNIQDNGHHPFAKILSAKRSELKKQAREMPVAIENNQQRRKNQ